MASPPTSRDLTFRTTQGELVDGPREWTPHWLEVPSAGDDWSGIRVMLDGNELPLSMRVVPATGRVVVSEWPRAHPGRHLLRIVTPRGESSHEVRVPPYKISPQSFAQLVDEIEGQLPASIALNLQQLGAFGTFRLRSLTQMTRTQDLARLRSAVEGVPRRLGLIDILHEVGNNPHTALENRRTWVAAERARRPDPTQLTRAITRQGNLNAQHRPMHVVDLRPEQTYDVYENRIVALYVNAVYRRLRSLARASAVVVDDPVAAQAGELVSRLERAMRAASFLDSVSVPESVPVRITMVLLRRPAYHAAFEGFLEFSRNPSVTLEESGLDDWLDNLPRLYGAWAILQIIDVVAAMAGELGYGVLSHALTSRRPGELFLRILPDAGPILSLRRESDGTRVDVMPECTYGPNAGEFRSVTYEQRPAISIVVRRQNDPPLLYLFDPTYLLPSEASPAMESTGEPAKADLDSLHAYRDAIRAPDNGRPVRYAAIVYPGSAHRYPAESDPAEVEVLRAYPGDITDLHARLRDVFTAALAPRLADAVRHIA